jgi:quercetin dioxygenase-like cupin family protein
MCKTTKLTLVLGGALLACASGVITSRVARATPPQGVITNTLIAGPVTFDEIDARVHTPDYTARLKTRGLSDAYVQYTKLAPGGDTGWHSHPGSVFVAITSGVATHYDADFTPSVYPAGTGFVEDPEGGTHILVNGGDTNLELVVFFLVPKGAPRRIDEPAPQP